MELQEATENGNLFTVKVFVKTNWLSKLFGGKDRIDEIVFNKISGCHSQSGLIAKGSFDIAMHEYYKRYATFGAVKG